MVLERIEWKTEIRRQKSEVRTDLCPLTSDLCHLSPSSLPSTSPLPHPSHKVQTHRSSGRKTLNRLRLVPVCYLPGKPSAFQGLRQPETPPHHPASAGRDRDEVCPSRVSKFECRSSQTTSPLRANSRTPSQGPASGAARVPPLLPDL